MEEWNPYRLNDFEWEMLEVYLKHGYGDCTVYDTLFFCRCLNDQTELLTLSEFAEKAVDYEGILWADKIKTK